MDDHTTISTFQLFKMFPDNESARVYLEARLIEAESAHEAKRKFAKGAFSQGEMTLITATPVSSDEIRDALADRDST